MNLHLSKEYRAIGPFWLVALAMPLAPLPFAYDSGEGIMFCVVGYILGCALLGAAIFSQEWNHQTMDLLLVQPVSRTRLWRGKMRILGFALTSMVLAFLPGLFSLPRDVSGFFFNPYGFVWIVFPVLWAMGAGPFYSLHTGSGIAAFVFSILTPFAWILAMLFLLPNGWTNMGSMGYEGVIGEHFVSMIEFFVFAVPLILFAFAGWRLAHHRFQHLETAGFYNTPVRLTDWVLGFFKPASAGTAKRGALRMLVRKEFRLHEVSHIVAACATLVSAMAGVYWLVHNRFSDEPMSDYLPANFIMVMALLNACIVPITVGASAVAEERQMGVLSWQLTLPPSRFRQWSVKMLVAYGHHIVLGMLLPLFLLRIAEWIGSSKPYVFIIDYKDYWSFGIICAVSLLAVTVSLFATSLAKTTLRAILMSIGTIILAWAFVGILLMLLDFFQMEGFDSRIVHSYDDGINVNLMGSLMLIMFLLGTGSLKYCLAGVAAASIVSSILWLGYTNYRRLENRLGAFPQIALVGLGLVILSAFPFTVFAFRQIDARAQTTGLSGRALAAYLTKDDPDRVVEAINEAMDDPVRGPLAIGLLSDDDYAHNPKAVPIMARALSHSLLEVRIKAEGIILNWEVWHLLFRTSSESKKQISEKLTQNLQDPSVALRYYAIIVLANERINLEKTVPAMVRLLEEPTASYSPSIGEPNESLSPNGVRRHMLELLKKLGPAAKAAVPALEKIVSASLKSPDLRYPAFLALTAIDPESARQYHVDDPKPPRRIMPK